MSNTVVKRVGVCASLELASVNGQENHTSRYMNQYYKSPDSPSLANSIGRWVDNINRNGLEVKTKRSRSEVGMKSKWNRNEFKMISE